MGAELVFEVWEKGGERYVRILYSGQSLETSTPMGTIDMINVDTLLAYFDEVIPEDLVDACIIR